MVVPLAPVIVDRRGIGPAKSHARGVPVTVACTDIICPKSTKYRWTRQWSSTSSTKTRSRRARARTSRVKMTNGESAPPSVRMHHTPAVLPPSFEIMIAPYLAGRGRIYRDSEQQANIDYWRSMLISWGAVKTVAYAARPVSVACTLCHPRRRWCPCAPMPMYEAWTT